jgi:MFS family permease
VPNRGWVFALLIAQSLFAQYLASAMRPSLTYAVLDADSSVVWVGVVAAVYALPSVALAIPAGVYVDKIGEKPIMVVGAVALLASSGLALFGGRTLPVLVASATLLGIGHLLAVVGGQVVVANGTTAKSLDSMFGFYSLTASMGQALGPLTIALPGADPHHPPLDTIFFICTLSATLLLAITLGMRSTGVKSREQKVSPIKASGDLLRIKGMAIGLLASSIVLSSVDILLVYLPLLGESRGLPVLAVSMILTTRAVFSMVSRAFLGQLGRAFNRSSLMAWCVAIAAVSLAALTLPLELGWLIACAAIFGFTVGTCQPLTMSWISASSPPGSRGLGMSLRLATNRLGQTVIPAALGPLAALGGGVFVLLAVAGSLALTSGAIALAARPSKDGKPPSRVDGDTPLA